MVGLLKEFWGHNISVTSHVYCDRSHEIAERKRRNTKKPTIHCCNCAYSYFNVYTVSKTTHCMQFFVPLR